MSQMTVENPLGLDGFEFAEFTSPNPEAMKALIEQLGFRAEAARRCALRSCPKPWCNCGGMITALSGLAGLVSWP